MKTFGTHAEYASYLGLLRTASSLIREMRSKRWKRRCKRRHSPMSETHAHETRACKDLHTARGHTLWPDIVFSLQLPGSRTFHVSARTDTNGEDTGFNGGATCADCTDASSSGDGLSSAAL
eukprot:2719416-Rhodomonas_salina.7